LAVEHAALLRSGVSRIAGVDEAGRGPLAGPVVAAAVLFPADILHTPPPALLDLNDSKALTAARRDALFDLIHNTPGLHHAVAVIEPEEIDRLNILRATHLAMARALEALTERPDLALIDGLPVPGLPCPSQNEVKGDARCLTIAAASILAKVTRDRIMIDLDQQYPQYGFARHKGYGTRAHLDALNEHGPCPAHRQSFAPVRQLRLF
jgi:ribonuclease HII